MMILYHGSHTAVEKPLAKAGRKNLDFGQGFYLTSIESQAKEWAKVVASRRGLRKGNHYRRAGSRTITIQAGQPSTLHPKPKGDRPLAAIC